MEFRRLAQGAAWTAVAGALLVLGLWLVVVAINWRDEAPSADALRLQRAVDERPAVADEANAYVLVLGLGVPAQADPLEWGMRRKAFIDASAERPAVAGTALPGEEHDFAQHRTAATKALIGACREGNRGCLSRMQDDPEAVAAWLDSERWLLERYGRLIGLAQWRETVPTGMNLLFPPWSPTTDGQRLLLVQAWQHARQGESDAARDLLQRDLVFWRMLLRSSDTLITKMVATAAIRRHFTMGNLVLRELAQQGVDASPPPSWNMPIDRAERSMHRAYAGEWQFSKAAVNSSFEMDGEDTLLRNRVYGWALAPLFKRQATINLLAANLVRLSDGLDVEPGDMPRALSEMARPPDGGLPSLYNPVGQMISRIGYDAYMPYAVRASDLEGVRCAATVAADIRRNPGSDARAIDERLRDATQAGPCADTPFARDEAAGSIVFQGLQPPPHGRHTFVL